MNIWEKENNKIYDNVHFSTESKERILDELMKEIDKEFTDEDVKKEGNIDYTWENRRNEKMKKNNMEKLFKTTVAAAFAVAATGAILYGVNSYVNGNGKNAAKQVTTIEESMKETEQTTEKTTEQSVKGEDGYVKAESSDDIMFEKVGEGFYSFALEAGKEAVVGECTFKCDGNRGILIKRDEKSVNIGVKLDKDYDISEISVVTDGNTVYYDKEAEVYKYDISKDETSKVCTVPVENAENNGAFANIVSITENKILFNAGVGGWWCTEVFALDMNNDKVSKVSDGFIKFVEGDSILIQREFVSDVSPVPYDIYKIDGDKIEKVDTIIEKGLYADTVNGKYYFHEWNYDSMETYVVRCDLDGSNIERVADLTKGRPSEGEPGYLSEITDTYCVYYDVKYTYDK